VRKDQFAIGRFEAYSAAAHFARTEAMRRNCCCMVRRNGPGRFDVVAYQSPPIKDLLLLAIGADLVEENAHFEALRRVCLNAGLSPSGWTFVSQHGINAFEAALQSTLGCAVQFINAVKLIEWQAVAQLPEPLPRQLAEPLMAVMGMLLTNLSQVNPRLAPAALNNWTKLDELSRKRFVAQEWVQVLVWMRDHDPQLDKNQWRAGWPAIARKHQRWASRIPNNTEWDSALCEIVIGRWKIRSLDSAIKLAYEGLSMQHCVASYADQCRDGTYRVFSVTKIGTTKPAATIGIEFESQTWQLDQVKGKSNATPPSIITKVAHLFVKKYQHADRRMTLESAQDQLPFSLAC
jgi:hypothetical protein